MSWLTDLVMPSWAEYLLGYVLLLAIAFGLVWAIYDCGKRDERADWQAKEAVEVSQAQSTIDRLSAQNKALGQLSLGMATAAKTHYEQELTHEKDNFNRTIADVRAGAKRLSIPTKQAVPACAGGISLAAATAKTSDAETRTELSDKASEFLIGFANDADQAVIESNYVKDLLLQCRSHVDTLRLQSLNNLTTQ